ncbi:MAG: DegT/DnrJ/EryC1/StrS family aminotransferase [Bacteroidetes bacterium]|nr:DegT/DnrJ/EryC1/StrS family aminotransferase [Bacteroidota bacterium]
MQNIPLSRPSITALERDYVARVLDSGRLALGPFVEEFEERMATVCGTKHAVAVSSGTAALHLIVRSLGIGTGDEVVTTPYSFIASANAAIFEGAQPVFADVNPLTYNIDPAAAERAVSDSTAAILAVDVFGLPADWERLETVATSHGLALIDDACEALGATNGNRRIGSIGNAAAFGFYPNKQITTGEGGCITTDSDELAALCRSMRNQGRNDDRFMEHGRLGFNYRMAELPAAVGCAQLERLPELLHKRSTIAGWYANHLADCPCVLPPDAPGRSWFVYVIRIPDDYPEATRDELMQQLALNGIQSAPYFPSLHTQPFYRERFGLQPEDFPVSANLAKRTLALPFFADMTEQQVATVAETVSASISRTTEV